MPKKKLAVRHRNKKGRFSKRGKRERVYSHAKTILRRIAKEERARAKREKEKQPPEKPPIDTGEVFEFIVNFSYEKSGRSFDIVVTGHDETEAYNVAIDFLQHDREAQRIIRSGLKGWQPSIAKGARTNVEAGNAEYRNDTEA